MIELGHLTLFSIEDVSQKLGVSKSSLSPFIKTGELKARRIGKSYFITEKSLEDFFECTYKIDLHSEDTSKDIQHIESVLNSMLEIKSVEQ
ncbi:MAG: helix-turn-helix domain-containing protein [Pseudomonadota bacterium]